jgi:RNA polymerase sigma-70 factor (ECF subfamily)
VHQQVLSLRFLGDLSHAETAQIVGKTEGAIRVIQHRALQVLRQLLTTQVGEL